MSIQPSLRQGFFFLFPPIEKITGVWISCRLACLPPARDKDCRQNLLMTTCTILYKDRMQSVIGQIGEAKSVCLHTGRSLRFILAEKLVKWSLPLTGFRDGLRDYCVPPLIAVWPLLSCRASGPGDSLQPAQRPREDPESPRAGECLHVLDSCSSVTLADEFAADRLLHSANTSVIDIFAHTNIFYYVFIQIYI